MLKLNNGAKFGKEFVDNFGKIIGDNGEHGEWLAK